MSSGSFKNAIYKMSLEIIYLIYMYKKDLALNDLQCLICHIGFNIQIHARSCKFEYRVNMKSSVFVIIVLLNQSAIH